MDLDMTAAVFPYFINNPTIKDDWEMSGAFWVTFGSRFTYCIYR